MPANTSRQTLQQLVSGVMRASGLNVPGTIVGSPDQTALQMVELATDVGQQLLAEYDWKFLERDFTIVTTGATTYPLPVDYDRFIQDAQWNRSSRLPAIGALTEQEWQMLKARNLAGTTLTILFRLNDSGQVELPEPVTAGQTVVMPYVSRGWVQKGDLSFADNADANDDVILYDAQLFRAALRLAWYDAKQFNIENLLKTYERTLSAAKAKDSPARALSLAHRNNYPYLGSLNLPDTGYGF